MAFIDTYRENLLTAPGCSFLTGDRVFCRRSPAHHEFEARVVGVTIEAAPRYDVRDANEQLFTNVTIIRLNEPAMADLP